MAQDFRSTSEEPAFAGDKSSRMGATMGKDAEPGEKGYAPIGVTPEMMWDTGKPPVAYKDGDLFDDSSSVTWEAAILL